MKKVNKITTLICILTMIFSFIGPLNLVANAEINEPVVFADFENDSVNTNASGTVTTDEFNSGLQSLKYEKAGSYSGWNVEVTTGSAVNVSNYDYLDFWVKDTQGNNGVQLKLIDSNGTGSDAVWTSTNAVKGQWTEFKIDLSKFTTSDKSCISKIAFWEWNDGVYYIDDITFGKNPVEALTVASDYANGTYSDPFDVTLSASKDGSDIYYTTDGTEPTTSSNKYSAPITVDKTMKIKAMAVNSDETTSVATYSYVINSTINTSPTWLQNFEGEDAATTAFTVSAANTNTELSGDAANSSAHGIAYSVASSGSPEKASGSVVINSMSGPIDTRNLNYLIFYIKDTQGSNSMKVSLIDEDGNETDYGSSGWYDLKTSKGNWKQYYVLLNGRVGTVDRSRITGVRIGQWNSGTYYIDSAYFDNYLYTGTPDSGIQRIAVDAGDVKSTVNEGNYYVSQSTELVAADGYDIYYTTDGNDPTTSSTKYSTSITLDKSTVVKAIAVKDGNIGNVVTFTYKIIPYDIKGDHGPGTYTDSVVVEFRSKNNKDLIYYTTDGTEPTIESTRFYKPIMLTESINFKVRSYSSTSGEAGQVNELAYVINKSGKVSTPKFSVSEGTYYKDQSITITSDTQDAVIYYTLDGTTPNSSSTKYEGPISITNNTKVKTVAISGDKSSDVITKEYKINGRSTPFLKADGKNYKNNYGSGDTVVLRGTNVGGWLLPENWQCPTNAADLLTEENVLAERFGEDEAEKLIRLYEDNWWTEEDFDLCKKEGINMLRLPISYFEMLKDDGTLKANAFERLDWFVEECAERGIYVQIDMHGAVGSQNGKDHSGDTTIPDVGNFYGNEANIQKTIEMWEAIAKRFKENPWICGYDLLNEPSAVGTEQFETYDRIYDAIRKIDKDHIIFMQAIWEPTHLPDPSYYNWENISYEYHFYGWDVEKDADGQKAFIQNKVKMVNEYTNYNVPLLVGEFSFFSNPQSWENGLNIFEEQGWNYTTWTYKVTGEGSSWGLYTKANNPVDIYKDSLETIEHKWSGESLNTSSFTRNNQFANKMKTKFEKNTNLVGVTSVSLDKSDISMKVNGIETLTAVVSPMNATYKDVTWSSDNENVATVENGVVKAIGKGTATITLKNIGGKTGTCTVTVNSNGAIENTGNTGNGGSSSSSGSSSVTDKPVTESASSIKEGWNKNGNNWIYIKNGQTISGWLKDTDGKWYCLDNNGAMKTGWIKDTDGKWYCLDSNGAMKTGWVKDKDGKWYCLDNSGAMKIGWLKDTDGKWYYLYQDGSMASNTSIDGYVVGIDGDWQI